MNNRKLLGSGNSIVLAQPVSADQLTQVGRLGDGRRIVSYRESDPTTLEEALGLRDRLRTSMTRRSAPEIANADRVNIPPEQWFETADLDIDSVVQIDGTYIVVQADYNVLANLQYLRDAAAYLGAVGRNDQSSYVMTGQSGTWTYQGFSSPNALLGFQVEWGLAPINGAAFNMAVTTSYFNGANGQSVNRNFTLRVNPFDSSGGIFQFLFANRTQGVSPGYHYDGLGGMNVAIIQPAVLGSYDESVDNAPLVEIAAPSSLANFLSFNLRPITAASPALAALRERYNGLTSIG